ncbi:MAG TPA: sugar phosphate isomerase/epimerase family protein [Eubacteriales bacterium]|nr:sugar phosphate isomerase/epimerase family protein [Eubacteriales bacterium]
MLLSTEHGSVAGRIGDERAIRLFAAAGFDALDLSLDCMTRERCPFNADESGAYVRGLIAAAKESRIVFNQAHAPFSFRWEDARRYDEDVYPVIIRSFEICSRFGIKTVVVHPVHYLDYRTNADRLWDVNMRFYQTLLPYAEKYDLRIGLENMLQRDPDNKDRIFHDMFASPDELACFLDELGSDRFVACLDTGHEGLVGEDIASAILRLGHGRLKALHVHDIVGSCDHLLACCGELDWDRIAQALAQIGYDGDFTFESVRYYARLDTDLLLPAARFMEQVGRSLIRKIESGKAAPSGR